MYSITILTLNLIEILYITKIIIMMILSKVNVK
jgi:hypothetical protein